MENDISSAALANTTLDKYYQSYLKQLPMAKVDYTPIQMGEQTVESIGDSVSAYLRNYYDQAIKSRRSSTQQNTAALDVDAASRGMGGSTWLIDAKNRQYQSEAADINDLEGEYASKLAETIYGQYNNYLTNKLSVDTQNVANKMEVDQWNAQARTALEQLAYERALEAQRLAGIGSGGGRKSGSIEENTAAGYREALDTLKKLGVYTRTASDYLLTGNIDDGWKPTQQDWSGDGFMDYLDPKSGGAVPVWKKNA